MREQPRSLPLIAIASGIYLQLEYGGYKCASAKATTTDPAVEVQHLAAQSPRVRLSGWKATKIMTETGVSLFRRPPPKKTTQSIREAIVNVVSL